MGLFDDEDAGYGGGLGLAPRNNTPVAHNIDSPLFKIGAILQGVSSGMRGQPNPAMLQMRDEMALRQRRDAMVGQAEKAKLAEEKEDFDQVSKILDVLTKSGAPPEHTTKVLRQAIKSMPRLSAKFGGMIDQIELTGKPEEFVWKGHKADKDLTDVSGKVWPAGKTYNVTGSTSGGKLSIKSVEDIEAVQEPISARQDKTIKAADLRAEKQLEYREGRDEVRDRQWQQTFNRLSEQNNAIRQEMKSRYNRLSDTAITKLTDLKEGEAVLTELRTARAKAFSSGQPISEALKGALLTSSNAATVKEAFIDESKATNDNDRAYISAHNAVIGSLYKLTSERQMSEPDAVRNLRSFNPAVSQKQFEANINPRINSLRRQSQTLTDAYSEGRNVPDALRPGATQGGASGAPSKSEVEAAKKRLGITK